jgi:hypothetical protein
MERAKGCIVHGLMALFAALLIWKLTGNFWGWLILFIPGATLIVVGWIIILRQQE